MREYWQYVRSDQGAKPRIAAFGAILAGLGAFAAFFQPVVVQGKSMLPTLRDGQVILMDRQHYRWHGIQPKDIVIFRHGRDLYIKRVYATAGQTVKVVRSNDGASNLVDGYADANRLARVLRMRPGLGSVDAVRVPPQCVFVVGDNLNNSLDSRDFGPIPADEIVGYVPDPLAGPPRPAEARAAQIHLARQPKVPVAYARQAFR